MKLTESKETPTDRLFTGQRLDDTGLYYYGARYYDPTIGRFISADTIIPDPFNPQAFNRYSYCLNNPLKYIDPSGHYSGYYSDYYYYDYYYYYESSCAEAGVSSSAGYILTYSSGTWSSTGYTATNFPGWDYSTADPYDTLPVASSYEENQPPLPIDNNQDPHPGEAGDDTNPWVSVGATTALAIVIADDAIGVVADDILIPVLIGVAAGGTGAAIGMEYGDEIREFGVEIIDKASAALDVTISWAKGHTRNIQEKNRERHERADARRAREQAKKNQKGWENRSGGRR